ncbi:MAG: phosphoribosylaminoimidazolesuccinocarboxamide synthase, partial [Saprospiraceae bacterium]|nr:phosphoribosylaminoimidazolesuccinocarboxamide synthase [Saprospiraceae bacterium]
MQAVGRTSFQFPGQTGFYSGKVRDVYFFDDRVIMIASDRISAFDHVLPRPIPCKGQVLNQIAAHFLRATAEIVPNWLQATPDPNVSAGLLCEPVKIEMVIRGYLAGHAWREYNAGKRVLCGVAMPEGLRESDPFPEPIITPATKAEEGHDEDISREEILERGIVSEQVLQTLEQYT